MKKTLQTTMLRAVYLLSIAASISLPAVFATAAQAQTFSGVAAGIVYPRASDRFFEEGRDSFERETQRLANPRLAALEGKLAIDEALQRQTEEDLRRREDPRVLPENNSQTR